MTQTALNGTCDDATLDQLAAFIVAEPTRGVYIYTDTGVNPAGIGVAASTFLSNAALQALFVADASTIVDVEANLHVFPTTPNRKIRVFGSASIYTATTATAADFVANVANGTILYVSALGYRTNTGLFYKILDGTYVNDYIRHKDVEFLFHDSSTGG